MISIFKKTKKDITEEPLKETSIIQENEKLKKELNLVRNKKAKFFFNFFEIHALKEILIEKLKEFEEDSPSDLDEFISTQQESLLSGELKEQKNLYEQILRKLRFED